jgi:SAM-dependent methyltransferase
MIPDCGALRTSGERIMAEQALLEPGRFHSAARHYLAGRPAYAPRLIHLVARLTDLAASDRVLDLGCGPGMLAGAFAPLAGEVTAVDPEPEMLRIAEAEFGAAGPIRFIRGSSFDLSPALGRFRLVTMGRSFHWMDRAETLRRLDGLVEPAGTVALFNSEHRDVPDNAWLADYRALVRSYAADDLNHPKRRAGSWLRHEVILLDSPFNMLNEVSVVERRQVTIGQLVERAFSRSGTAPDRLGIAAPKLAAEIEALLQPVATDGTLTEVVATGALLARRPGGGP